MSPHTVFPELISPHLRRIIDDDPGNNPCRPERETADCAIAAQFRYDSRETVVLPTERVDPLGEDDHSPVHRLIRKYSNRALLLVTDTCAAHCRYCFRRRFVGARTGAIAENEVDAAARFLESTAEITELLLSGGDPLTLSPGRLRAVIEPIRRRCPDLVFRICTRVPVVAPDLVSQEMIATMAEAGPSWVVVQVNHRDELVPDVERLCSQIIESGLPMISQTVLLAGVNDSVETLASLFEHLVRLGVKPYQLFQADLVPGTSHFRVPLPDGVALYQKLKNRLSTLALPVYAVDAPGGGGKIALGPDSLARKEAGWFILRGTDGMEYRYPDETPHRSDHGA